MSEKASEGRDLESENGENGESEAVVSPQPLPSPQPQPLPQTKRARRRRASLAAPTGSDPEPFDPPTKKRSETENDERLRADRPPHWG